ncbi:MAG: MarR family transcriptional regulator, partial [Caldilineaceae bacterium]|nr:MarR family transcriptional regulator [Caldilineaceae bacterium]
MRTFCGIVTDGMLDYLATIYKISNNHASSGANKVTTTALAERMHVSTAAASSMLKRLEESRFVERSGTDG